MGPIMIVAYSNQLLGEIGTIYQASNAIYTGLTQPGGQANYIVNGKQMSGWMVRKKFGTRSISKLRDIFPDSERLPLSPKHRYVFITGPKLKRRQIFGLLEPYMLPYPKRPL